MWDLPGPGHEPVSPASAGGLSTTAPPGKPYKILKMCFDSSTDEWINKMWYIHTMAYYSALKWMEILIRAITWMNLEDFMLSEISQPQKDKYYITSLI